MHSLPTIRLILTSWLFMLCVAIFYMVLPSFAFSSEQLIDSKQLIELEQSLEIYKTTHYTNKQNEGEDYRQQGEALLPLWREAFSVHKALAVQQEAARSSHVYNQLSQLRADLIQRVGAKTLYGGYSPT